MKTVHRLLREYIYKPRAEEIYASLLKENLGALANQLLSRILTEARSYVPYYTRFNDTELNDFGVLNKPIIKTHFKEMESQKDYGFSKYVNSSGGSTGAPQSFLQDTEFKDWGGASELYFYREFLGMDYPYIKKVHLWGDESAIFGLKKGMKNRIVNIITQTRYLNAFKMNERIMNNYVNMINRYKPILVRGYAEALYQLSKFIKNNNLKIFKPKFIVSSAETLRSFMRQEIEMILDQNVSDFYGSREVGAIAGQCKFGTYHVFNFNNFVEIVDGKNEEVSTGEDGRILITTLHNYSMPLIRYELGDQVVKGENECACGSALPTLQSIKGRTTDYLISTNGDLVHGEYFTHLFYFCDKIMEFQVIQNERNTIQINYVAVNESDSLDQGFQDDAEGKIRLVMGNDCSTVWNRVEECDRTVSGKFCFTICRCM